MARPRVAGRGDGLQIWRIAANVLNKQSGKAEKRWSPSLGVGRGEKLLSVINEIVMKCYTWHRSWTGFFCNEVGKGKWIWDLESGMFGVFMVIKSRRMKLTGHVARMGEMRNAYRIFKIPLGRPGWGYGPVVRFYEHGYETSCSLNGGEFHD
jgi:hypothetical protein